MKKPFLLVLTAALPVFASAQTNGLLFDGIDDRVVIPNTALNNIGEGDFTVEAWVKADETAQAQHPRIFSNRGGSGSGFMFFFHDLWGGSLHKMLAVQMEGTNYILLDNGLLNGNILDGTCRHVAVAREVDTLHFYVDGSWIGDRLLYTPAPTMASPAQEVLIGNDLSDAYSFSGGISQVRIWNRTRTMAEIVADMSWSIAGNTPDLVGYWELNDGAGQVVVDKTGAGNGYLGTTAAGDSQDPTWSNNGCAVSGVGIDENMSTTASLWPSPAHDVITIGLGRAEKGTTITVCDALGNVVRQERVKTLYSANINVADLSTGLYFAIVRSNGNTKTLRFAKE
ncbi:MAG: LamG-like jellyroll fold domain-containing protein [Flavobacteriales bacterium]